MMINKRVLVSSAKFFSADTPINPYYGDSSVNEEKAQNDHQQIISCFEEAGIEIIRVDAPQNSQDGVYTANWALVKGNKAVMSNLPDARKAEEKWSQQILENLGYQTIKLPENLKFSGQGDALPCGKYLLAGSGYRSDEEAQQIAAQQLGFELVQLHAKPEFDQNGEPVVNAHSGWNDSFFYDIDLAISIIRPDLIAYCKEAFDEESQTKIESLEGVEKIEVSYQEAVQAFACNLVSTGSTVIMSPNAPKLKAALRKKGLKILTPHVSELTKGGGYIRCISLSL